MTDKYTKLIVVRKTTNFREAVKLQEMPVLPPEPDYVGVKVMYVGVNASDVNHTADKSSGFRQLPFDVGLEALGIIDALGENVSELTLGQPVVYYSWDNNAYSEYLYVRQNDLVTIPSLNPEYLALFVGGFTPALGLDQIGKIKAGDKVLITAAAGGAGHMAVQWAKHKGCHVIGMTSSREKVELLKGLAVDSAVNYKTQNWDQIFTEEFPDGFDMIWETIGGQVYRKLLKHLAVNGRMVMAGRTSVYMNKEEPDLQIPSASALKRKNQLFCGFDVQTYPRLLHREYIHQLMSLHSMNKLKAVLDFGQNTKEGPFHGIQSVVRAVEHIYCGKNMGKVVVKVQE